MQIENLQKKDFKKIFINATPLLDVRAPVEFAHGSLPGAVNLPILNDAERALIGTTYKQQGSEAAVALGYQIISGDVKAERVAAWKSFLGQHPEAILYCFRGGKRSQITQQWLREAGVSRPLLVGGYKAARQFLMEEIESFSQKQELLVVSGPTGSGKTHFLHQVQSFYPSIDLELLARHRGSVFGDLEQAQPTQIDFENHLAQVLLRIEDKLPQNLRPLVEDESRVIGKVHQPNSFFERLRRSEVVWLDEPFDVRVTNVYQDYIMATALGLCTQQTPRCAEELEILRTQALQVFAKYRRAVTQISTRLGGLRAQEVLTDLAQAESDFLNNNTLELNRVWIEKLLRYYYDPLYLGSLERRQVKVLFKGSSTSAADFLRSLKT
ncbi:MAG: tRNA 2-selenouridine(34) synthase MnmH [Bdellovibrio sp.]|nr:tRNA 2-selenouridine(34) synthase MnmH [Bdellovibrio sp.]